MDRSDRQATLSTLGLAAAVFVAALAVRLVYLTDIRSIPLFEHPAVDGRVYHVWGQRIAAGDWLGDEVFYQAPAYPYFLGLIYAIFGQSLGIAHVVQVVVGALVCVLVFLAGREVFDTKSGMVAGLLMAFYAPAIFFDGIIQKAGLGALFLAGFLYLAARGQRRPATLTFALCGAVLGLLALTWENALLFAVLVPLWILVRFRDADWKQRVAWAGGIVGGTALVLVPVGIRNYAVGRTFALTTFNMGTNFYIGNNPQADGLYAPLVPGRQEPEHERHDAVALAEQALGRPLSAGEVSRYWLSRGIQFVREQPGTWLKLLVHKWALVWNRFEPPDAEDLTVYTEWSALLRALCSVLHFGTLAPLAVAGMVLAWPGRRDAALLYLLIFALAASVAAFFVFARYRYPLAPMLVLFAGYAVVAIGRGLADLRMSRWPERKHAARPALAVLAAAATALWVNRPIVNEEFSRAASFANLGAVCAKHGRPREAEQYLRRALGLSADLAIGQEYLGRLLAEQGRLDEAVQPLREWLAREPAAFEGHALLAQVLAKLGRTEEAIAHYRLALAAKPDFVEAREELAAILRATGREKEAEIELERVALLKGAESATHAQANAPAESLAQQAAQRASVGRFAEAVDLYGQALTQASPDLRARLHYERAGALAAMEKLDESAEDYRRAIEIDPRFADAHNNLGMVYGRLNDPQSAERHYRLAIEAAPDQLSPHYNRGTVLAHLGRYAEAAMEMERCLELLPSQGRMDLEPRIRDRLEKFRAAAKE